MSDFTTTLQICRTCMCESSENSEFVHLDTMESFFNQITFRQKLEAFAPELDLTVTFSSVICSDCVAAIEFIQKFKKKCLESEERIQNIRKQSLVPEQYNHNGSFLKITDVESLSNETTLEETKIKCEPNDLDTPTKTELPHLQIVDFNSVLFNTDDNVEITHDIDQESSNGTCLAVSENISNENSDYLSKNNRQYNYTIFETFNTFRMKRTMLYKCNECTYSVTSKSSVTRHSKNHSKLESYQCEQCGYKNSLQMVLLSHAQNHRKKLSHNNSECEFTTALVSRLNIYRRRQKCEKLFLCIVCNLVFQKTEVFNAHLRTHKKELIEDNKK